MHLIEVMRVFKPSGIAEISKPSEIAGVLKPTGITGVSKPSKIAGILEPLKITTLDLSKKKQIVGNTFNGS